MNGQPATYHKEHLSLVNMREEKLSVDGIISDFIIIGLSMKMDKGGICREVIATPKGDNDRYSTTATWLHPMMTGKNTKDNRYNPWNNFY